MHTQQKKAAPRRGSGTKRKNTASRTRKPTPDVVYTPAKPFNRSRFLLKLLTVVAVVVAIVFGISIFFKVETVVVSGAEKYTAWEVRDASGIRDGENLLTFNRAAAGGRIRTELPYVDTVRIGITLPNQVNIEITELEVVYALQTAQEEWWLVTSSGRVVEPTTPGGAQEHTRIDGVLLKDPKAGEAAQAINPEEAEPEEDRLSAVVVGVDAGVRLKAALSIAQYLEAEGVIGQAAVIDVTDTEALSLWYGQQYQVLLGDAGELSYKIRCMKAAIDQLDSYQSGVLDVSFTDFPDQPSYTPFS